MLYSLEMKMFSNNMKLLTNDFLAFEKEKKSNKLWIFSEKYVLGLRDCISPLFILLNLLHDNLKYNKPLFNPRLCKSMRRQKIEIVTASIVWVAILFISFFNFWLGIGFILAAFLSMLILVLTSYVLKNIVNYLYVKERNKKDDFKNIFGIEKFKIKNSWKPWCEFPLIYAKNYKVEQNKNSLIKLKNPLHKEYGIYIHYFESKYLVEIQNNEFLLLLNFNEIEEKEQINAKLNIKNIIEENFLKINDVKRVMKEIDDHIDMFVASLEHSIKLNRKLEPIIREEKNKRYKI